MKKNTYFLLDLDLLLPLPTKPKLLFELFNFCLKYALDEPILSSNDKFDVVDTAFVLKDGNGGILTSFTFVN